MSEPPPSPRAAPALTPARLKRRSEFLRVAARGKRAARPGLVLQALPAVVPLAAEAPPRLGFTVTKKIGNAVERNRARRRLKEAARLTFRDHPEAARGWDLVLIGREGTARRDFAQLRADLEGALRQLGAWPGGTRRGAAADAGGAAAPADGAAPRRQAAKAGGPAQQHPPRRAGATATIATRNDPQRPASGTRVPRAPGAVAAGAASPGAPPGPEAHGTP